MESSKNIKLALWSGIQTYAYDRFMDDTLNQIVVLVWCKQCSVFFRTQKESH